MGRPATAMIPHLRDSPGSPHRRIDEGPVLGEIVVDVHELPQKLLVDRLGVEVGEELGIEPLATTTVPIVIWGPREKSPEIM